MGAADIVPGVSGGTVAFITGIYERLLGAIRSFDLAALRLLMKGEFGAVWSYVDGSFLLSLMLGIATSIFSLARIVVYLLAQYPEPLWALFFGLILASALVLSARVEAWNWSACLFLLSGILAAALFSTMPVMQLGTSLPAFFLAGMVAVCAMILPGLSGSFLLVLLGMYGPVLTAVKELNFSIILVFCLGAGVGLMGFSRVLYFLLRRYTNATMASLTGFLFGSLIIVWPWKQTVASYLDRHGELKPLRQMAVGPLDYELWSGADPRVFACTVMAILGFSIVIWINRRSARQF
jgi:putative membrane protein